MNTISARATYYNESDLYPARWLRNLADAGHIPQGYVDARSITEVQPHDVHSYTQCHFFAGIAGWPLALRIAGWPADRPVWTGSCPCQPFSVAGKGQGTADERHLWPEFLRLIRECRPSTIFGEQVASKAGRDWLAGVRADLETLGYAVGAADLCAASAGTPHIRQRLFWVADARHQSARWSTASSKEEGRRTLGDTPGCGPAGGLEHANSAGSQPGQPTAAPTRYGSAVEPAGGTGRLGDTIDARLEGFSGHGHDRDQPGRFDAHATGPVATTGDAGFWSAYDLLACTDGKARRIEPGTFPLAHGVSNRVGRLRAFGNAIVPQVAATFIRAFMGSTTEACAI